MMEYKGYFAKVEFDDEADIFHGEVINLRDVITFEGETVSELKVAFHDSVDDYLAFCAERGEEPEKPYSGKFVVRVEPELHKNITIEARKTGKSLNIWVKDAIHRALKHPPNKGIHSDPKSLAAFDQGDAQLYAAAHPSEDDPGFVFP